MSRSSADPPRTISLLLADPFSVYRLGVRAVVADEHGFDVIEVSNHGELEEYVESGPPPDLALVDIDLPPNGVLEAIGVLRRVGTPAVVWARRPRLSPRLVVDIVRAGAAGVLSKEISARGLVRALRGATRGEAPLSREAATLLVEGVQSIGIAVDSYDRVAALSTRELEVLDLMSRGHSNRSIALNLGLSEFTAKRHVQNVLCKLDVHSRLEASASYHAFVERGPIARD